MKKLLAACVLSILAQLSARGVIFLDTGDPSFNTTAPTAPLANSGWQFQGTWGDFLGTPIAPHFFISAAHIVDAGNGSFVYQGATYTVTQSYSLNGSDLLIWQVRESFPSFAPLYTARDEVGQHLVVIGRGTDRGTEFRDGNDVLRGWYWGADNHVRRWGENDVANIKPFQGHDLLRATFDQHVQPNDHPNESHLSSGDSGGAVFLNDNGTWKLAGINYAVDDLYTAEDTQTAFNAALFDARGYYTTDDNNNFVLISGLNAMPSAFYASRIASELAWIGGVIAQSSVAREGNLLAFTYDRIIAAASDLVYQVEQSSDLVSWTNASTADEIVATNGDIQTIKAKIDIAGLTKLFVRLRITRPAPAPSHATASFVKTVAVDDGLDVLPRRRKVDSGQKISR